MRIALVQLDIRWEDPETNRLRAERRVREAAAAGAELVVLPEMFNTGFSMDAGRLAEPSDGATTRWIKETATGLGVHLVAGLPSLPGPENHAVWCTPTGDLQRYSKLHPFSLAGEDQHYRAGTRIEHWVIAGVRVTPFICYDLRFPEAFRAASDDTDLYLVIANWPERRRAHWQTLLRARAIENLAWVAGVNRCGDGGGLHYAGDSALISPWGETVLSAAETETVLVADVDPAAVAEARRSFPVLADRRPELRAPGRVSP